MAFWDCAETVLNAVSPWADDLITSTFTEAPIIGTIVNGVQGAYHAGSAIYDAATGDRDGAITHGVQGAFNALGCVPGLSQVLGAMDKGLGAAGGAAKLAGMETDNKLLQEAPQSVSDVAAAQTVMAANALLGADDKGTGTRGGEVDAGVAGMGTVLGPLGVIDTLLGNPAGGFLCDLFGTDRSAPTSGSGEPTAAQSTGQKIHSFFADLF